MTYANIGTVSEGTLRSEDLLDTFAGTLTSLAKADGNEGALTLAREAHAMLERYWGDDEASQPSDEELSEMVNALQDALDEFAPPYCYFGTHEGDGACFGFWIDWASLEDVNHDDDVRVINLHSCVGTEGGAEVPAQGKCLLIERSVGGDVWYSYHENGRVVWSDA